MIYFPIINMELAQGEFYLLGYFFVKSKAGKKHWLKKIKYQADWVSYWDIWEYCLKTSYPKLDIIRDYIGEMSLNDQHRFIPDIEMSRDSSVEYVPDIRLHTRSWGYFMSQREDV